MKLLFFIFVLKFSLSLSQDEHKDIQPPSFKSYKPIIDSVMKKYSMEIIWTEVKSDTKDDPILGYKIYAWEIPRERKAVNRMDDNGKWVKVEDDIDVVINPPESPELVPTIISTNETTIRYPMIPGISYEFGVKSFTKSRESALSVTSRVSILKRYAK